MPVQQQKNSSFAGYLGAELARANAQHRDAPIDTGMRRLPPGIKVGIAKLSNMYTKQYEDDKQGPGTKGKSFFRASAVVLGCIENGVFSPAFRGEKIAGMVTSQVVPLCATPARGNRKERSFTDNWYDFQNIFKLLTNGACVFPEKDIDPNVDPAGAIAQGARIEAFYFGNMAAMTDPIRMKTNPIYVKFSTRSYTPAPTPQRPNPEEMTFEDWIGTPTPEEIALVFGGNGRPDPAAGVGGAPPAHFNGTPTAPPAYSAPPTQMADGLPSGPPPETQVAVDTASDPADVVAMLVETAMADPEGVTEEGVAAITQLQELAWKAGWTNEQTGGATDWAQVGEMALNPPTASGTATTNVPTAVTVGSRWLFCKRTKEGGKLKNPKGEDFPPQEVVVATVANDGTCTVKTAKDNKDVVDMRSKKPVQVKFEWLEPLK